ncbi:MAG: ABC transporter ATP-binding protein, partial [Bryobacterales bacterium]|nr:ABC transporter ATP-binding protein [Bryobacterales bacterium]
MLEIQDLRKAYGDFVAVHSLSLQARGGEVFGLLGPNGAGKTTTIHCIGGLLTPTSGHIRVNGHDVVRDGSRARASLGVAPQEIALYEELSAKENLEYWGAAQGLTSAVLRQRIPEVLEHVGLLDRAKDAVKAFSGGMKRRMNFACGIIHRPKVLLLDEPTAGVDPQSRVRLLDLVREQARGGACVLYTTHYMEEAESLCDRLAIVDHGRLIAQGTLSELRAMLGEKDLVRLTGLFPAGAARLPLDGLEVLQHGEDTLALSVAQAAMRLPEIFAAVSAAGG